MMSMVRFRTSQGVFLAPTERVLEVRKATDMKQLPGAKDGVAGLIERNGHALTVLSTFGNRGEHVLLLDAKGASFGLIADEVFGVVNVSELEIEPAPAGQSKPLLSGVVRARAGLELMVSVESIWREFQKDA